MHYIGKCAESLFSQDYPNIEYIFVDDCSPDNSREVLKATINKHDDLHDRISILTHSENRGLPAARNTGLRQAKGTYVVHCDSDDFMESDMVSSLVECAEINNADFVWCNWFLSYKDSHRLMKEHYYKTPQEALRACLVGNMKYNVWNKLVRKSLYDKNNIFFPEGRSMGEDMTMMRLLACSRKTGFVPKALYHYVKTNNCSITSIYSDEHIADLEKNVSWTVDFVCRHIDEKRILKDIVNFKLSTKLPFLISYKKSDFEHWLKMFPEVNDKSFYTDQSLRIRLIQLWASRKWYTLLRMHYFFIYKCLYPLVYT